MRSMGTGRRRVVLGMLMLRLGGELLRHSVPTVWIGLHIMLLLGSHSGGVLTNISLIRIVSLTSQKITHVVTGPSGDSHLGLHLRLHLGWRWGHT